MKWMVGLLLLCGLDVPITASAEVREVVITFKTHFDIGYTDLARNVVQRYRTTMIDQALQKGVELSARGTLVTAFGPSPDGPGTVLRLWEHAGVRGPCEVRLPAGLDVKEVQPVNLRGTPLGAPLPVEKGVFTINLITFAPASFIIPPVSKGRP